MITLLVPTLNRSDFLIRLLRYYHSVNFKGCICIGDSSNAEHVELARKEIAAIGDKLNIIYNEYPHLNDSQCIQQLIELAPTPYAAFVADDDFLVPSAIDKCTAFLDEHPEYSAVHGHGYAVVLDRSGPYGEVTSIVKYPLPTVEGDSALERLVYHLGNYMCTLFSVHRTESWKEMYANIGKLTDKRFTELLPSCMSAVQGRLKELDFLYLIRHGHDRRYLLPATKYQWASSPEYHHSYQVFRDSLTEELVQQGGIDLDKAKESVEQAFSAYLKNVFVEPWHYRFGIPRMMRIASYVPGARQVWRGSRWLLHKMNIIGRDNIPAAGMLQPSSPFREDFIPVYSLLTSLPSTGDIDE
jgi:glycosyltransferase domain-containing protein